MSRSSDRRKKQIRRRLMTVAVMLALIIAIVITRIQLIRYELSETAGSSDAASQTAAAEQTVSSSTGNHAVDSNADSNPTQSTDTATGTGKKSGQDSNKSADKDDSAVQNADAAKANTSQKENTTSDTGDAAEKNSAQKQNATTDTGDSAEEKPAQKENITSDTGEAKDDTKAQSVLTGLQVDTSAILFTEDIDLLSVRKVGKSIYEKLKPELKDAGVPKRLIRLLKDNPETVFFVCNYPVSGKKKDPVDISADVSNADGIPHFLQWDERWGYRKYGDKYMAITGCGPTCLSMVRCGLGGDDKWDPYKVAKMAQENGYYINGQGTSWSLMDSGAKKIGLKADNPGFSEKAVRNELKKGHPVICAVRAGDFTTGGHFIVLTGLADDGKVVIADPYSRLRSDVTWKISRILDQAKNLWSYTLIKS